MKFTVFHFLRHPYALVTGLSGHLYRAAFLGVFVFVLIGIVQPFEHNLLKVSMYVEASLLGLATFSVCLGLNGILLPAFKNYFHEEKWTVGRELAWSLVNLFIVGLVIFLFSIFITGEVYPRKFIKIEFITICLGMIPIAAAIILRQRKLRRYYHKNAELMNAKINSGLIALDIGGNPDLKFKINQELQIDFSQFILAKTSSCGTELQYIEDDRLYRVQLKQSLYEIHQFWSAEKALMQCHKNYLVNLRKVIHISGNAQGYKLHLSGTETLAHVALHFNAILKFKLLGK